MGFWELRNALGEACCQIEDSVRRIGRPATSSSQTDSSGGVRKLEHRTAALEEYNRAELYFLESAPSVSTVRVEARREDAYSAYFESVRRRFKELEYRHDRELEGVRQLARSDQAIRTWAQALGLAGSTLSLVGQLGIQSRQGREAATDHKSPTPSRPLPSPIADGLRMSLEWSRRTEVCYGGDCSPVRIDHGESVWTQSAPDVREHLDPKH